MPLELPASLVEQLPVAALFVLCAAVAGRYAARLVDRLVDGQERAQQKLVEALERNTAAWHDTCAAVTRLEATVAAWEGPGQEGRDFPACPKRRWILHDGPA